MTSRDGGENLWVAHEDDHEEEEEEEEGDGKDFVAGSAIGGDEEDDDDDGGGFGLDFVFQDWLDPQTFTDHRAETFGLLGVRVEQGVFCHTKENDQTGAVVWDDAVMLARHLTTEFAGSLQGRSIIDLGAGTGFLGLAVARGCSADVVITDREVMRGLIERNVEANRGAVAAQSGSSCFVAHSWGEPLGPGLVERAPFDIVLASGCIYHEEANPALLQSLRTLAETTGDVYVAIDFRFDVTVQDPDDPYAAPVVASFLRQAEDAHLGLQELVVGNREHAGDTQSEEVETLALDPDHVKKSVKIFKGRFADSLEGPAAQRAA